MSTLYSSSWPIRNLGYGNLSSEFLDCDSKKDKKGEKSLSHLQFRKLRTERTLQNATMASKRLHRNEIRLNRNFYTVQKGSALDRRGVTYYYDTDKPKTHLERFLIKYRTQLIKECNIYQTCKTSPLSN